MIIMEEEESSNTVLHAVDIRAAKRKRRIQPVGGIIDTWVYYDYYPRYNPIIPDILEDILWRVGPLLQHGVFISTMTICCNLDLPQMT